MGLRCEMGTGTDGSRVENIRPNSEIIKDEIKEQEWLLRLILSEHEIREEFELKLE